MKQLFSLTLIAVIVLSTLSCRPNYETSRAAYERAMAAAVEKPTYTADTPTDDAITSLQPMQPKVDTREMRERSESVKAVDEAEIKEFSIVAGGFKQLTNAKSMRDRFVTDGYNAFVVQNAKGMYRVVVGTFDTRKEAEQLRKALISQYEVNFIGNPWLLLR